MMKRLLLLMLLIIPIVYAGDLSIEVKPVHDVITQRQCGEYFLYVTDNDYYPDVIDFKYLGGDWRIKTDPSTLDTISFKQNVVKLSLCPLSTADFGIQSVELIFWSEVNEETRGKKNIGITFAPEDKIIETTLISNFLDPRRDQNLFQIKFKNNYNVDFKKLEVELNSDILNKKETIDLEAFEEKLITFPLKIDEHVVQGEHELTINFYRDDLLFAQQVKQIEVAYSSDVKESTDVRSGLFINEITVNKKNEGNSKIKDYYSLDLNIIQKIFTDSYPEPTRVVRDGLSYTLVWETEIESGEEFEIFIVTGYRGFLITVLIFLLLLTLGYYYLGREVSINKKVLTVKTSAGGISGLKILLIIKNKSNRTIRNLRVLDRVPNLVTPVDDFGTLRPVRVKQSSHGRTLIWEIHSLNGGEEVVISYSLHTKMDIVGRMMLPTALVKYVNRMKRRVVASSNKLILFPLIELRK